MVQVSKFRTYYAQYFFLLSKEYNQNLKIMIEGTIRCRNDALQSSIVTDLL